jgi:hypothetical protein
MRKTLVRRSVQGEKGSTPRVFPNVICQDQTPRAQGRRELRHTRASPSPHIRGEPLRPLSRRRAHTRRQGCSTGNPARSGPAPANDPRPDRVEEWLRNTYTRGFNVRHRAWGWVFGDRYKAVVVEGSCGSITAAWWTTYTFVPSTRLASGVSMHRW